MGKIQRILKIVLCFILSIVLVITGTEHTLIVKAVSENGLDSVSIGERGGYLIANQQILNVLNSEMKFTGANGHGFSAERANNLIDFYKGYKVEILGDDNALNGPDRRLVNRGTGEEIFIQDKYYSSAKGSIEACFGEDGNFRYYAKGEPMQIEVPPEQFDEAVRLMEEKIKAGKVPGVTDPEQAKSIVRKGHVTYKQAVNITKAGNIDSLVYDAANGFVYATSAAGISFVLDFAVCKINGESNQEALENAARNGLKTGGIVLITHVISSQLSKTGLRNALKPAAEKLYEVFGEDIARTILQKEGVVTAVGKTAAEMTSKELEQYFVKTISEKMIVNGVFFVVLAAPDVADLFRGRISVEHFAANILVIAAGLAGMEIGSFVGGAIGTAIAPGVGSTVGSIVGGIVGGTATGWLVSEAEREQIEKDANEMYDIISEEFLILADDYMVNQEEADHIVDALQEQLTDDAIKDMYASDNRSQYACNMMMPLFEEEIKNRETIIVPSVIELRAALKSDLYGIIFIH